MSPKIAASVLSLLLVSACSTTPSRVVSRPPVPPSLLLPCPPLPYQAKAGNLPELGALVIVTAGSYYECKSKHDDLITAVKAREKLLTKEK